MNDRISAAALAKAIKDGRLELTDDVTRAGYASVRYSSGKTAVLEVTDPDVWRERYAMKPMHQWSARRRSARVGLASASGTQMVDQVINLIRAGHSKLRAVRIVAAKNNLPMEEIGSLEAAVDDRQAASWKRAIDKQRGSLSAICDRELKRVGLAEETDWDRASDSTECTCGHAAASHQQYGKAHPCTICSCKKFTLKDRRGLSAICDRELARVGLADEDFEEVAEDYVDNYVLLTDGSIGLVQSAHGSDINVDLLRRTSSGYVWANTTRRVHVYHGIKRVLNWNEIKALNIDQSTA